MIVDNIATIKDYVSWKWFLIGSGAVAVYLLKMRTRGRRCPSNDEIPGQTVIITGANSGIGKATALELAKRKARVILACRDLPSAEAAVSEIRRNTPNGELVVMQLDLASQKSIKGFAEKIVQDEERIDVLINNAGIYQCPYDQTEEGFEMQMGVNHLGHFYLTNLLIDHIKKSAPSRIVIVSSGLHKLGKLNTENLSVSEREYSKKFGYYNSKLANNLFARELSKRLEGSGISVFCLKPGMVRTNLGRHVPMSSILKIIFWPLAWLLVKSSYDGCQTVVYCSVARDLQGKSDMFFSNCKEDVWSEPSKDEALASDLWNVSENLTGLSG